MDRQWIQVETEDIKTLILNTMHIKAFVPRRDGSTIIILNNEEGDPIHCPTKFTVFQKSFIK